MAQDSIIIDESDLPTYSRNALRNARRAINVALKQVKDKPYDLSHYPDCGVYFVQARNIDGPIKIGVSRNVFRRLFALQISHYECLYLIGAIPGGDKTLEAQLQDRFWKFHIRGEWFRSSPELILFINNHCQTDKANLKTYERSELLTGKSPSSRITHRFAKHA